MSADKLAQAYELGAKGGTVGDDERLAFEEWMRGHCWALCATWDGKQYRSDAEQSGDVDPHAMMTRRLWAAWRDRAALAAHQAQQAQEPEQKPCLVAGTCKHGSWCSETYCQEHCKFVKEAPQPSHVPGWLPIETAPKDGRTVQLGYFNSHGKWRSLRGQWMSADYIAEFWEDPDDGEPGWYETSVEKDDTPNCWRTEPTHWAPLLPAPQQGDKTPGATAIEVIRSQGSA